MRVDFLTENLIENITLLGKILPSHSQIPILTSILLQADSLGLHLSSTDLEFGVTTTIPVKTEEEGGVLVPGRQFIEIINSLGKQKAVLLQDRDQVILETQMGKFKFQGVPKEEFPKMFEELGQRICDFTEDEFKNIFSKLIFAVSTDDARPHLTGVYIGNKNSEIHFVATDGYRMSLVKRKESMVEGLTQGLIISPRLIMEALSLKEKDISLFVHEKGNQVILETPTTKLVGRLIEGNYPDYEKVIPQESATTITVDREEFLKNARSVAVFARENAQVVQVRISENVMTLSVPSTSLGEAELKMEGTQKGDENSISFNVKYLLDLLKSIDSRDITIGVNSASEPSLFTTTEDPNFLHVIMPVRVQD